LPALKVKPDQGGRGNALFGPEQITAREGCIGCARRRQVGAESLGTRSNRDFNEEGALKGL